MKNGKKRLLMTLACALFAAAAVFCCKKQASAKEIMPLTLTDESLFETELKDGVLTVTGFHQPSSGPNITDIVVPVTINGQMVRAIGTKAFSGAGTNIHNLYLPDSLEILEPEAFSSYAIDNVARYTFFYALTETGSVEQPSTDTPTIETSSIAASETLPASLTRIPRKSEAKRS